MPTYFVAFVSSLPHGVSYSSTVITDRQICTPDDLAELHRSLSQDLGRTVSITSITVLPPPEDAS